MAACSHIIPTLPLACVNKCEYPRVQIRKALSEAPSNHVGQNTVSEAIVLVVTSLGHEEFSNAFLKSKHVFSKAPTAI